MKNIPRRTFLKTSGLVAAGAGIISCDSGSSEKIEARNHPLNEISRENIKITDIKVTPFSWEDPKGNIWRSGKYIVWKTDGCLTEVITDQGIIGIGEGSPYARPDRIKQYTEDFIKPALIGKNPFDVEIIACGGTDHLSRCSWAGVDNALWDVIGKAKNMPVYKLLACDNEPDPHIAIYASGGDEHEWYNKGDEFLINEAVGYKEQGFSGMKLRTGTDWEYSKMTLDKYNDVMRRLREAVGPDFKFMHETMRSQGLTTDEVIEGFCPVLEELQFHWFEEPMRTVEDFVRINEAMPTVMVSGGESHRTRFQVKEWIDSGAFDIVQTDCNVTGLTENWHISQMAHDKGIIHCPHSWHGGLTTMVNAHLVAGIPNRHMLELNMTHNPLKEGVFKEPLTVVNGYMDLPDKPGYGVEVIDDLEKKFPWVPGRYLKPNPLMTNEMPW
ncbi:enolase C-terminal domain-like protein [Bacteroidota bacterium]